MVDERAEAKDADSVQLLSSSSITDVVKLSDKEQILPSLGIKKPTSPKSVSTKRTSSRLELSATAVGVSTPLQIEVLKGECTSGTLSTPSVSPDNNFTGSFISGEHLPWKLHLP
jgi:hypothetical protein